MNYLDSPVEVLCLDASNKPNEIKISNWIVKDRKYTVIATAKIFATNELGYKLAEVDTECPEYPFYKSTRFGLKAEDLQKLFKIQEDIDIEKLLEETVAV